MSKIFTLIRNENIKTMKKISTKIMLALAILMIFLAVGFSKLMEFENKFFSEDYSDETWKEELNQQIQMQKQELQNISSPIEKAQIQAQIETDELALENNINRNISNWKVDCLYEIESQKTNLYVLKEGTEEYNSKLEEINKNITAIKNDDYNAYVIDTQIQSLNDELKDGIISKDEYDDMVKIVELKKKYEIGKENAEGNYWKENIILEIEAIRNGIRTCINTNTGKVLSIEELDELKETEKIDLYRLENNMPPVDTMSNYRSFYDYISATMSMSMIAILAIIIGGSAISSEISKGTIKFWVMTPNKRWKILLSKLINIVIIVICSTIILAFVSNIIGGLFFKEEPQPYLYVQNGQVQELNPAIYKILNFLTYDIDIFVYTIFAIMLSAIIRNTALSIGITVAAYTGANFAMQILNMFVKADWLKYIPFNNMNLTDKIFSNSVSYTTTMDMAGFSNNVSLQFSLCVLIITTFLMLITTFDSFNKRDII